MWPFRKTRLDDFPPRPKWQPTIPVDCDRIIDTFSFYSDDRGAFAVFRQGTCVPIDPTSNTKEDDARAVLHKLLHRHPDFNPLEMDDGNWMVAYSDAAYSICYGDEITDNWDYIVANHLDGLATHEVLLSANQQPNKFDKRGIVGLFARARWFMDAQSPDIYRTVTLNNV